MLLELVAAKGPYFVFKLRELRLKSRSPININIALNKANYARLLILR